MISDLAVSRMESGLITADYPYQQSWYHYDGGEDEEKSELLDPNNGTQRTMSRSVTTSRALPNDSRDKMSAPSAARRSLGPRTDSLDQLVVPTKWAMECLQDLTAVLEQRSAQAAEAKSEDSTTTRKAASWTDEIPQVHHHDAFILPRKPCLKRTISSLSMQQQQDSSSFDTLDRILWSRTGHGRESRVRFGRLHIREYSIELSDNPSCSMGPPVQLGWTYQDEIEISLDDYERFRVPRRSKKDMLLSKRARCYLLLKLAGYSKEEIKDAIQEVDRVKVERSLTEMLLPVSILQEAWEELVDQVQSLFSLVSSNKLQKLFLN